MRHALPLALLLLSVGCSADATQITVVVEHPNAPSDASLNLEVWRHPDQSQSRSFNATRFPQSLAILPGDEGLPGEVEAVATVSIDDQRIVRSGRVSFVEGENVRLVLSFAAPMNDAGLGDAAVPMDAAIATDAEPMDAAMEADANIADGGAGCSDLPDHEIRELAATSTNLGNFLVATDVEGRALLFHSPNAACFTVLHEWALDQRIGSVAITPLSETRIMVGLAGSDIFTAIVRRTTSGLVVDDHTVVATDVNTSKLVVGGQEPARLGSGNYFAAALEPGVLRRVRVFTTRSGVTTEDYFPADAIGGTNHGFVSLAPPISDQRLFSYHPISNTAQDPDPLQTVPGFPHFAVGGSPGAPYLTIAEDRGIRIVRPGMLGTEFPFPDGFAPIGSLNDSPHLFASGPAVGLLVSDGSAQGIWVLGPNASSPNFYPLPTPVPTNTFRMGVFRDGIAYLNDTRIEILPR